MNGALMEIEFLSVHTYAGEHSTLQGGEGEYQDVKFEMDTRHSIQGKNVVIVEDIVDTGLSMKMMLRRLAARDPKSLRVCSLLSKPSRRAEGAGDVPIHYLGFKIEDRFVIGYGLDFDERYRELPYIGYLCENN